MYVPPQYQSNERHHIQTLIAKHPFATLITAPESGAIVVSQLPLLGSWRDERLVLSGHLAKANSHWRLWESQPRIDVIFNGPNAYVSAGWYKSKPEVPTWNYVSAQMTGTVAAIHDREWLHAHLIAASVENEQRYQGGWDVHAHRDFIDEILPGIVGFEISVSKIEMKMKLGQNKKDHEDRLLAAKALVERPSDMQRQIGTMMKTVGSDAFEVL